MTGVRMTSLGFCFLSRVLVYITERLLLGPKLTNFLPEELEVLGITISLVSMGTPRNSVSYILVRALPILSKV